MPPAQRPIDPAKVAIYIRWSTEDQGEGTTLEVQKEACTAYLVSQGWAVNPDLILVDDGYSGATLDRPAMTRLRAAVAGGQVDCVVVFKLDRLSRNVVDTVNLVLREWEGRCYLKSAREPIDTIDHAGKMFFYTLVSFAEWERSTIRDRTYSGRLRRAQEGRNPGRRLPLGYTTGERRGEFAVVPAEAELVRRIFRDYVAGASVRGIATGLNQEGIPAPRGGAWTGATIARILANEMYTGRLVWGAVSRTADGLVPNEKPLVAIDGALPAIIGPDEFALVQAIRRGRPSPTRGQNGGRALSSAYLLSGVLVCGLCGGTMRARPPYDRNHALYFCINRFHQGPAVCDSSYIRQPDLDAVVVGEVKRRYGDPAQREAQIRGYLAGLDGEVAALEGALQKVQGQLADLAREEAGVRKLLRQQQVTVAEYRQLVDDLRQEAEAVRARERALTARLSDLRAAAGGQAHLLEAARQVDHWDALAPREQKQVLRFFVARVKAYRAPRSTEVACEVVWKSAEPGAGGPGGQTHSSPAE